MKFHLVTTPKQYMDGQNGLSMAAKMNLRQIADVEQLHPNIPTRTCILDGYVCIDAAGGGQLRGYHKEFEQHEAK